MFGFAICLALVGDVTPNTVEVPEENGAPTRDIAESAARQYRISVYNKYRTERPTYDEYIEAGEAVWKFLPKLPRESGWHGQLVDWFSTAQDAAEAGESTPLAIVVPEDDFEHVVKAKQRAEREAEMAKAAELERQAQERAAAEARSRITRQPARGGFGLKALGNLFGGNSTTKAEIEAPDSGVPSDTDTETTTTSVLSDTVPSVEFDDAVGETLE